MTHPFIGRVRPTTVVLVFGFCLAAIIGGPFATAASGTDAGGDETVDTSGEQPPGDDNDGDGAADPEQAERDAILREGAAVYSQICSSCHQPGGAGLPGQFPPLIDNPNVEDTAYVTDVIVNGLRGEIMVGDTTYDGVMPSFSTLSDDEIGAVVAYIQNDFLAPQAAIDAFEVSGPTAGTDLPGLASFSSIIAYLLAASIVGMVLAPRLISVNDRLDTPWLDAWLKTAVIVFAIVFLTVVVPDWALKTSTVAKLGRFGQDVVGSGLWGLGFVIVIAGLWYAHRESRI